MAAIKKKVGPFKKFIKIKRTASSDDLTPWPNLPTRSLPAGPRPGSGRKIVRHGPGGPKTKKR